MDLSIKKTLKASEHGREDIKKAREKWQNFQQIVKRKRLIFIDETGAKTNMTRLYGRAQKGSRCHDSVPGRIWKRTTILSAIRDNGETYSHVFEGALNSKIFEMYIEKILLPKIKPHDIVIMDNLNVHKSKIAKKYILSKKAKYIFLPAYSPDLNPIEKMWSKIKQILRGLKARTREELASAIDIALGKITRKDAAGWFSSRGYIKI